MICDYHVHSTYCDGINTLRECVEAAINKGVDILGFSGHSFLRDSDYTMSQEGTAAYKKEIEELKDEYKGRIRILCGLEKDFFSNDNEADFDFVIGSLHAVEGNGRYFDVDHSADISKNAISEAFGSDPLSYCEAYFNTLSRLFTRVNATVIGHLDLINKFSEKGLSFDTSSKRYVNAFTNAVDSLIPYGVPFEINTGAIMRGYRSSPYPSYEALKYIHSVGGGIIICSDSHRAENICGAFDLAFEYARSCGFKERYIITENGYEIITL